MQTIIIVLEPKKMENPDLDIRYLLPERIEEITEGMVRDNGYDYLPNNDLGIWLDAEEANKNAKSIIHLIKTERISDNDLSGAAEIYVSEENCADLDKCQKVYPI